MLAAGTLPAAMYGGSYLGDDATYQSWLRNPSARVGHIVILTYHGTSAVYPNYVQYTLKLSDYAVAGFQDVVRSLPAFTRSISADLRGELSRSYGAIVLDNGDGRLDLWHNLAIDGQAVRVYHGDPDWPVARFRIMYEGIAEGVEGANLETITIRVRGAEHSGNQPIQTNLISDNLATTAPSNRTIPLAYGKVFNVTPATIDESNQVRQWHDGAVTEVTEGRDGGVPFRTKLIAISAVNAGANLLSTATVHGFYRETRVRCDMGGLPAATTWAGLAWNGRVFCLIGPSKAATSVDGIKWTERTISARNWRAIAWNGRVFCAIAQSSSKASTSPDGITWTERDLPVSVSWRSISWNGSVFCAIANSSDAAATSSDGVTWTARTLPASTTWRAIAANGSIFIAVASGGTTAASSPDGITWTARTMPSSASWQAAAWNGRFFCAVAESSTATATSADGITWAAGGAMPSAVAWFALAWNGDVFCATAVSSTAVATSPDGVTWTARTLPAATTWSIAASDNTFCVAGDVYSSISTDDGASWTGVTNTLPSPLAVNTDYWVIADGLTPTDFKLSATRGGAVIDITTTTAGASIVGHHWTADLTTGKVYLDSRPAGVFTLDGTAGSTLAADILPEVLSTMDVDTASQTAFATLCPAPVGIYVDERRNRLDVARDLMTFGALYGPNRLGQLYMDRIEVAPGAHDATLLQDEFLDGSFVLERLIPPMKQHRIGYRHNFTNQDGQLFADVSEDARVMFSTDFSSSPATLGADEGPAGQQYHKLAVIPDAFDTMLTYGYDANVEALRRNTLFYGWGAIFAGKVGLVGSEMDPGDVIHVTHSRFGLSAGKRMALVHVEDHPTERATVLKFFAQLDAYAPVPADVGGGDTV